MSQAWPGYFCSLGRAIASPGAGKGRKWVQEEQRSRRGSSRGCRAGGEPLPLCPHGVAAEGRGVKPSARPHPLKMQSVAAFLALLCSRLDAPNPKPNALPSQRAPAQHLCQPWSHSAVTSCPAHVPCVTRLPPAPRGAGSCGKRVPWGRRCHLSPRCPDPGPTDSHTGLFSANPT